MREWMREKMRRRPKRGPNDSESTGKIGQEIPANQPAPLRPSYEAATAEESEPQADSATQEPAKAAITAPAVEVPQLSPETAAAVGAPDEPGKLEIETQ